MRKPRRIANAPVAQNAWRLNKAETSRAHKIIAILRAVTPGLLKEAGVSRRSYKTILSMFQQQGHCMDRPRSGRPLKYTAQLMESAIQHLVDHRGSLLTTPKLVSQLRAAGLIHGKTDLHTFTAHLKAAVRKTGHFLNTRSTSTTFTLLESDWEARRTYALDMLRWLSKQPLEMLWFTDETQLQAAAHPKGKAADVGSGQAYSNMHASKSAL